MFHVKYGKHHRNNRELKGCIFLFCVVFIFMNIKSVFAIQSVFSLASRYVMCTFATTCAWNGKHTSIHFPSHKMSTRYTK